MYTIEDYRLAFSGLLPPGLALSREPGAALQRLLTGLAAEGERIDQTAAGLVTQACPGEATELLQDWERVLGLPDPLDASPAALLAERRAAAVVRLTANTEPTVAKLTAAMDDLGYVVTIEETDQGADCEGSCEAICDASYWAFGFIVHAPETTIVEAGCNDHCQSPLRDWGNDRLELAMKRMKPAHLAPIFKYDL